MLNDMLIRPRVGEDLRPLVSLIVPMYNEGPLAQNTMQRICEHMAGLERSYRWELFVVDDGSRDTTGSIADEFAAGWPNVHVLHHRRNCGLGQSLRTGFEAAHGDYVITLDADLSYGPNHIDALLEKIRATEASVVIASPYMDGGSATNIPWLRRVLSVYANRYLAMMARNRLTTLTGMVRAYDGNFLRSLNLREMGTDINPKVIQHARIINARVVEIPAHLSWPEERRHGSRISYAKIIKEILSVLLAGFLFRPYVYFLVPGITLLVMSLYSNTWMLIHVFEEWHRLSAISHPEWDDAVAAAFTRFPHTFFIGSITLMLAIELIGLAVISLQNKLHFDETYFMATSVFQRLRETKL
jgi:glycosyltransferase involved in cell wall biosynthesis